MTFTDDTPTIYCTRSNRIIDTCLPGQEVPDTKRARLSTQYGPDLIIITFGDAWQRHETAAKSDPVEITPDQWDYALNVLPPVSWKTDGSSESFKMSERLTGAITAIYVRLGEAISPSTMTSAPHMTNAAGACTILRRIGNIGD